MEISKRDGTIVDSELLRPRSWVESQQAAPGSEIPIFSDELELKGLARVIALSDCPPLAEGDGEVITGRFVTRQVEMTVVMQFSNGETLEGTAVHPIWSPEREEWLPMAEFHAGDAVLGRDGWLTIRSIEFRYQTVPVYNLEVHGEHVYQVTNDAVLVHNGGPGADYAGNLGQNVPNGTRNRGTDLGSRQGREFRLDQLALHEFDPNQPAHVRGWLANERRRINGTGGGPREIRTPKGYVQAHGRATPAREGFDYSNARLQGEDLNKLEESVRRRAQSR